MELSSRLLSVGCRATSSLRRQYRKGAKTGNFTVEKPDKHASARGSRSTSTAISRAHSVALIVREENGTWSLVYRLDSGIFKFRSVRLWCRAERFLYSPSEAFTVTLLPPAYPPPTPHPMNRASYKEEKELAAGETPDLTMGSPLSSFPWRGSPPLRLDFEALQVSLLPSLPPGPTHLTL